MLNREQLQIVNKLNGPMIVIACPGSGKTTVIVNRTNKLIESGVNPSRILVITFTKEAATQMQDRFEKQFSKTGVMFGTIHAICYRILSMAFHYKKEDILLGTQQWEFFRQLLYKKVTTDNFDEFVKNLITEISYVRNTETDITKFTPEHSKKDVFLFAYLHYEEYKRKEGKIDFDDMLILTRDTLKKDAELLEYWQNQFSYIMVDEYQDTSGIQDEICTMLADSHKNICVVGDDDQSIYRFRGANSSVLLNFSKKYNNCEIYYLSENYRSGSEIVKRAASLIEKNRTRFKKDFIAHRQEKGTVNILSYDSSLKQALETVNKIEKAHKEGMPYEEMSVLYRTNSQNQLLIGLLMKRNIPFYTTEPPKDYHEDFIFQDICAYYRLTRKKENKTDLQRILNRPQRYIKAEAFKDCSYSLNEMIECCKKYYNNADRSHEIYKMIHDIEQLGERCPVLFCKYLYNMMDYKGFIRSFTEYCQKDTSYYLNLFKTLEEEASQFETMEDWMQYAKEYSLMLQEKRRKKDNSGVCLSTFHSAKGLEWKQVFIIDANEDFAPYKKAVSQEDKEEERRLFYVGVTRAKDNCSISYIKGDKGVPSPYLKEMGFEIFSPSKNRTITIK